MDTNLKRLAALLCSLYPDLTEEQAVSGARIILANWDNINLPAEGTHKVCVMVNDRCVICGDTE